MDNIYRVYGDYDEGIIIGDIAVKKCQNYARKYMV